MKDARDDDEGDRVSLEGLDPVAALKALLAVDPNAPPVDTDRKAQPESSQPMPHHERSRSGRCWADAR